MVPDIPYLTARMRYAQKRVDEFRAALQDRVDLPKTDICVYITGSYGRLEAHENSDLDLFFLSPGSETSNPISKVEKALFDCSLINTARALHFPEFTKGGIYLTIHYLHDILSSLGSPEDDYKNYFTARMLLLLESLPVLNDKLYDKIISDIVDSYYRDYHDHEVNFRPAFLVNDIHRYWITMCLNYEHIRNRKDRDTYDKNRSHLKNVKLKFSRLMTCYSMIAPVLSYESPIPPQEVISLAKKTPIARLLYMAEHRPELEAAVEQILSIYSWFLERTGKSESEVIEWIAEKQNRDEAFSQAREFGRKMFSLVTKTPKDEDMLRYLIV